MTVARKIINLSPAQENAYLRLSKICYFTAANLERDEQILKGLVGLGLAKMTKEDTKLSFIRCPTNSIVGRVKLYGHEPLLPIVGNVKLYDKPKKAVKRLAAPSENKILSDSFALLAELKKAKK